MEHKVQGITYKQLYRKCGKPNCKTCQDQGHGPYWYAVGDGKPLKYVGKELPGFVKQYQAKIKELKPVMDAVRKELGARRDEANRTARECGDVIRNIEHAAAGDYFDYELLEKNGIVLFLV